MKNLQQQQTHTHVHMRSHTETERGGTPEYIKRTQGILAEKAMLAQIMWQGTIEGGGYH